MEYVDAAGLWDLRGSGFSAADLAQWQAWGLTPEQIQMQLDYGRAWQAMTPVQQQAYAAAQAAERAAVHARREALVTHLRAAHARAVQGDIAGAAAAVVAAVPEMPLAQAMESARAVYEDREPVYVGAPVPALMAPVQLAPPGPALAIAGEPALEAAPARIAAAAQEAAARVADAPAAVAARVIPEHIAGVPIGLVAAAAVLALLWRR